MLMKEQGGPEGKFPHSQSNYYPARAEDKARLICLIKYLSRKSPLMRTAVPAQRRSWTPTFSLRVSVCVQQMYNMCSYIHKQEQRVVGCFPEAGGFHDLHRQGCNADTSSCYPKRNTVNWETLSYIVSWTWNETIMMCFKCRRSALIWYLHPNWVNGEGITTHFILYVVPPFWVTKSNWTIGCSAVPWPGVCYSLIISFTGSR